MRLFRHLAMLEPDIYPTNTPKASRAIFRLARARRISFHMFDTFYQKLSGPAFIAAFEEEKVALPDEYRQYELHVSPLGDTEAGKTTLMHAFAEFLGSLNDTWTDQVRGWVDWAFNRKNRTIFSH
eukprot:GABV01011857.1.p1 GENE.GABV01011857.1~~GABV01011857.1.p1  ORF type:complete len:125 (-),score=28.26 GABV01011857.1:11-385(-)